MKLTKPDLSKLKPKNIHIKKFKIKNSYQSLGKSHYSFYAI